MNIRGAGWKALLVSAVLILLSLGSSFWLITAQQQRLYNEDLTRQLLTAARMVREALREGWATYDVSGVAGLVHTLQSDGASVVIISADGNVLVNTSEVTGLEDDLLEQPEVRQALLIGWGEQTRYLGDDTLESKIAVVRVGNDETTLGVVWLARPAWNLRAAWGSLGKLIALVGLIALLSTLTFAFFMTYIRRRLLRRLADTARSLSAGDFSASAEIAGSDEYAALSAALNQMRRRLAEQVETIDRQRLTLESLVDQLHEGVIVTRPDGCVALINPAAAELLNLQIDSNAGTSELVGLPLEQCISQHELQNMLRICEPTGENDSGDQEARLQIDSRHEVVHLLARASDVILPEVGEKSGMEIHGRMLVLMDITELTRIIRVKTDFVANASHELRTPLAAIRAAVETLVDVDLQTDAEAARRFLGAIERQSGRLEALVSDLLDLSKLESPLTRHELRQMDLSKEIEELHLRFADRLEAKEIQWETCFLAERGCSILASTHLFRLVLDNLVDNAIKFTEKPGAVRVIVKPSPGIVTIEVADDGCGIPEQHQQRIFERFYQVERARSGDERGTGLGLSIVRHAIAAMNGQVSLVSKPGVGTEVTVTLPRPASSEITSPGLPE